ncbi:hypothetical protein FRB94_009460 [Tulasnella sp. JGI-2019a]|nr:hypothetical protein FRB93_008548 [Tulasnella sp. JGI-2019a]KAG8995116.1 hypothetical protein FRB94_009460 [Tulasnella sp. JGI-2019a]KAG9025794.1 hypothetical protein FRB95_009768 [Tulasnella sp. JGI-2019a]
MLHVVNDTIWATGTSVDHYSHRDVNVRNAMFILTCIMPVIAAAFAFFGVPNWSRRFTFFSFSKIVSLWFISIDIFGITLYLLPGQAPRILFIWGVLHGQIETALNMLLLGFNGHQALAAAWVFGLVQYGLTLSVESMVAAFAIVAIIGGANDFLIFEAMAYGKQWGLAAGAMCHIISGVTSFVGVSINIGVVPWNVITFFALWGHIFFILRYILAGPKLIRDPTVPEAELEFEDPLNNPLHNVHFSAQTIAKLIALALVGSTVVTLIIIYVL